MHAAKRQCVRNMRLNAYARRCWVHVPHHFQVFAQGYGTMALLRFGLPFVPPDEPVVYLHNSVLCDTVRAVVGMPNARFLIRAILHVIPTLAAPIIRAVHLSLHTATMVQALHNTQRLTRELESKQTTLPWCRQLDVVFYYARALHNYDSESVFFSPWLKDTPDSVQLMLLNMPMCDKTRNSALDIIDYHKRPWARYLPGHPYSLFFVK
jgi:hypothetical protein